MPDEISQAIPEEQITPEEEVQETTAEDASTQKEPQQEKPLTAEDYRQIAREEAMRVAQSQVAKSENRVERRIQERFAALEMNKGTLKLSEEQVQAAQQQIVSEETLNAYKPPASGLQASDPQWQQSPEESIREQVDFVFGQMNTVFQNAGVEVLPTDPEFKGIEKELNNPKGSLTLTLAAAAVAADKKAARVNAQRNNAQARTLGGGANATNINDISAINDSEQLYTLGEQRVRSKK